MGPRPLVLAASLCCGVLGFVGGALWMRPVAPAQGASHAAPSLDASFARLERRLDEIADAQSALATRLDDRRSVAGSTKPPSTAVAAAATTTGAERNEGPDPLDAARAVADANALIDDAIAHGRWTNEDGMRARALLGRMGRVEHQEVRARVFAALNRQEIAVDDPRWLP